MMVQFEFINDMTPPKITPCPTCLQFADFIPSNPNDKLYSNAAQTATVTCPDGSQATVNLPAGIVSYVLTFSLGTPPYPDLTINCTGGTITVPVPDDTTQAQLDTLINGMLKTCLSQIAVNIGCVSGAFFNTQQTLNCTVGDNVPNGIVKGASFPAGITINGGSHGNNLVIAAGIVESTISVEDANLKALQVLYDMFYTGNAYCSA